MTLEQSLDAAISDRIAAVFATVTKRFGVTIEELRGPCRLSWLVHARHVAAWLFRDLGLSYPDIGRILCRNHTTIMASVRRVERERGISRAAFETLEGLRGAA